MGLTVPEEAIIHHGDVVRGPLPFPHQYGAGPWERRRDRLPPLDRAISKGMGEQTVQFLGDRPCKAAVKSLLPRVRASI